MDTPTHEATRITKFQARIFMVLKKDPRRGQEIEINNIIKTYSREKVEFVGLYLTLIYGSNLLITLKFLNISYGTSVDILLTIQLGIGPPGSE